jgi:hypothetical protein
VRVVLVQAVVIEGVSVHVRSAPDRAGAGGLAAAGVPAPPPPMNDVVSQHVALQWVFLRLIQNIKGYSSSDLVLLQ